MSKQFTPEEKALLVKRHLLEDVPISQLCEENAIRPAVFQKWLEELFRNSPEAFKVQGKRGRPSKQYCEYQKIRDLEAKLARKDDAMAQLLAEHLKLKKKLGLL